MKTQLVDFYIHPLTIIYIAFSIFEKRFSFVIILFLIGLFHELFHVFCARIFNLKIKNINVLPIGCFASIEKLEYAPRKEQLIILLLGPFSFFFTSAIIKFVTINEFINKDLYLELMQANLLIMIFNLLPIEPLDGGKILKIFLSSIFDEYKAIKINAILGIVFAIIISGILIKIHQYIFAVTLLFFGIKNMINIKKDYKKFLCERLIHKPNYQLKDKVNNELVLYRYKNNYSLNGLNLLTENKIITSLLYKK